MNVLQVSWSDRHGGAAIAASRLDDALRRIGVASSMMSLSGFRDSGGRLQPSSFVHRTIDRISARLDRLPLRSYPRSPGLFSPALAPGRNLSRLRRHEFDIAHLHWINNGFLRISSLPRIGKPLIWTLHDMWAFTGGCHYASGCERYRHACGACPQLDSGQERDLSYRVLRRKASAWAELALTVVTPSRWLAAAARSSRLFASVPIEVIPNCLDTEVFVPGDRRVMRARFGLPENAVVLLFGALTGDGDRRKGFHLLGPLLAELSRRAPQVDFHLAVFGMARPAQQAEMPFPVTYLGHFTDPRDVASAYSVADVFVMPSLEDNLPNTVMEAASCGVPVVAFDIGGLPDLIDHRRTGYLARPFDVPDLASGVVWLLEDTDRHRHVASEARRHVLERFAPETVARQYAALYERIARTIG